MLHMSDQTKQHETNQKHDENLWKIANLAAFTRNPEKTWMTFISFF